MKLARLAPVVLLLLAVNDAIGAAHYDCNVKRADAEERLLRAKASGQKKKIEKLDKALREINDSCNYGSLLDNARNDSDKAKSQVAKRSPEAAEAEIQKLKRLSKDMQDSERSKFDERLAKERDALDEQKKALEESVSPNSNQ